MENPESSEYIATARVLAVKVADCADQIDADRRVSAELGAEFADAGFFRLLVPKSLGGVELDPPAFFEIVRIFAEADASVAWCISQNNIFAMDSARMPVETGKKLWADQRVIITNGPPAPGTLATPVEGGYRLSGHWNFSSGSSISTWLAAKAPVEGVSGEPRMFLVPKADATMIDSWQVNGLRGTASFSFEVDDVFVPVSHTYLESDPAHEAGPIYAIPKIPLFATGFGTISLALARACLDDAIELAGKKTQQAVASAMRDRATVHLQIGEAEARLRSAEAYLRSAAGALWRAACGRGTVTIEERIEVRMASTNAIRQGANVVDSAYDLFGSDAIFNRNLIQRRFQDVHTIQQQVQGRRTNFETAGRFFLGMEPGGPL